ncbi:MAG: DUF1415 domain-containing protein [Gammaproteobacteria bacterium]|nr:DUF1415 domain-containing protein [Gammaproteobacteria bacterium]
MNHDTIIEPVRRWVEQVVIDLNLCPFAKHALINGRVRFRVSEAVSEDQLLADLLIELDVLSNNESVETTLLIHPQVLKRFDDYNQFLNVADYLVEQSNLRGVYQVASFHPHYRFSGTGPGDAENYTNRSPYPMLHLLREDSVAKAIDNHPDASAIPTQNVRQLRKLGTEKLRRLLRQCAEPAAK